MPRKDSCVCWNNIANLDDYNVPKNYFIRWDREGLALAVLRLLFEVIPDHCGYGTPHRGKTSEDPFSLPFLCDSLVFASEDQKIRTGVPYADVESHQSANNTGGNPVLGSKGDCHGAKKYYGHRVGNLAQ